MKINWKSKKIFLLLLIGVAFCGAITLKYSLALIEKADYMPDIPIRPEDPAKKKAPYQEDRDLDYERKVHAIEEAYFWASVAVEAGDKRAKERRDDAEARLTPEQKVKLDKRVEEWVKTHPPPKIIE